MARRTISALLLLAMAVWSELTLAPLLSLHAQMATMNHDDHEPPAVQAHACCPKAQRSPVAPQYAISAAGLPCADEHRCCFRQGPQSAPATASSANRLSKELVVLNWETVTPNAAQHDCRDFNASAQLRSPPGDLNMVLRT